MLSATIDKHMNVGNSSSSSRNSVTNDSVVHLTLNGKLVAAQMTMNACTVDFMIVEKMGLASAKKVLPRSFRRNGGLGTENVSILDELLLLSQTTKDSTCCKIVTLQGFF